MKRLLLSIISLVLLLGTASFAGTWVEEEGYWKYDKGGGVFAVDEWETIDGIEYHFDDLGHMATGLVQIGTNYHYFYDDGKMYEMGKTVDIMGKACTIVTRGKIAKMPDDWSEEAMAEYEEEKKRKAAEKKELIRNQKAFEKAIGNTPQLSEEQIAMQNIKKAENNAANATSFSSGAASSFPKMQIASAEKRTGQYTTEEGNKMTLTVAIPTFTGVNSEKANVTASRMIGAIGKYLEEDLGKQGGTYKFTTIAYVENTDQVVVVRYKSETANIVIDADIDFVHDSINIG